MKMQLRELRLVGPGMKPARLRFEPGTNVVSGDSDTGKSYMLRCIDFVFGAKKMNKALRIRKSQLEQHLKNPASSREWAGLDPIVTEKFCGEVEAVLEEWEWASGDVRVEFDQEAFDINIDGKPRQSHGKGLRAILHAAFVIGLLRFCHDKDLPHPGFVVLDSPLTTLKKGQKGKRDEKIAPRIENAFWRSLAHVPATLQIVVLDNKEPPLEVLPGIKHTLFCWRACSS